MTKQKAYEKFKAICERSEKVDPNNEYDWFSLSMGFFLALGVGVEKAQEWSTETRYKLQYWS